MKGKGGFEGYCEAHEHIILNGKVGGCLKTSVEHYAYPTIHSWVERVNDKYGRGSAAVRKGTCDICEIKHTSERTDEQFRHLVDPEKCAVAEKSFGRIASRVVYYRGPDFDHASGVRYRNVENYLWGLLDARMGAG